MKNSIHVERDRKYGMSKYLNPKNFQKTMDELENEAKEEIEKILDDNIKDTTDNVLKQNDLNASLSIMKKTSGTTDTFRDRIKLFLLGLLEKTN